MDVREKLVELLGADICKYNYCEDCECFENEEDCFATIKYSMADHLIAHGVTVQEWISVDDRLPEDSGYYLVVYRDKYNESISIDFDMYVKCNIGEWWESEFACDITKQFLWAAKLQEQEVTHWMPLPQPPKGE